MTDEDVDLIFKVVLVGDSGVGKSNILSRYLSDEFTLDSKSTVGVEFGAKKLKVNNMTVKAQIWDTAGQERYKSITNAYYKGAKGALLVYDVTNKETFTNTSKWISELKLNGDKDVTIILIGNKCDLENERQVSKEEGNTHADFFSIIIKVNNITLELAFLETSALKSINIDEAFKLMVEGILIFLCL